MSDFTKEELEAICYDLKRNENPWQCGETIINKIQSLINNYCEHPHELASIDTSSNSYGCGEDIYHKRIGRKAIT